MTNRDLSDTPFHELAETLERLNAGAVPDAVIDDAFVDALIEWLGPVEAVSAEAMQSAIRKLQAAMKCVPKRSQTQKH